MIEFYNREREIGEILRIMKSRPDLITFVYGPINSGKTELFQYLIRRLPNEFVVFYVNLRGRFIKDYDDFLRVLFKLEKDDQTKLLKMIVDQSIKLLTFKGIPVSESVIEAIFGRDRSEDVFEFLEDYLSGIAEKRRPILILDELQVIGDLKVDGLLIYKLFNFFIRLTKELHICHVFAITSDSLFLERVYEEAMLHGRCRYLLVDDFDFETTKGFLRKYGFSEEEIELVWQYFGGKPIYLVEAVKVKANKEDLRKFCEDMFEERFSVIVYSLKSLKREKRDLFDGVIKLFERFKKTDVVICEDVGEEVEWAVKKNVLFLDPRKRFLKPQSRLDLLAIRKILEEI